MHGSPSSRPAALFEGCSGSMTSAFNARDEDFTNTEASSRSQQPHGDVGSPCPNQQGIVFIPEGTEGTLILSVPQTEECPCPIPTCRNAMFKLGISKDPNRRLLRHFQQVHRVVCNLWYKCAICGYSPPEGSKYPSKYVNAHLLKEHAIENQNTAKIDYHLREKRKLDAVAPSLSLPIKRYKQQKDNDTSSCPDELACNPSAPANPGKRRPGSSPASPPRTKASRPEEAPVQTVEEATHGTESHNVDVRPCLDVSTLLDDRAWFDDTIIFEYMKMVVAESEGLYACVDPIQWLRLTHNNDRMMLVSQIMAEASRKYVFPICENSHWVLTIWDHSNKTMMHIDPLGNKASLAITELAMVCGLVITYPATYPPKQTDGYNCGPHICLTARDIVQESEWHSEEDVHSFRSHYLDELLQLDRHRLLPDHLNSRRPPKNLGPLMDLVTHAPLPGEQPKKKKKNHNKSPGENTPNPIKEGLISQVCTWFDNQFTEYGERQSFDRLEWIVDVLTAAIHMASVGDTNYVAKIVKRIPPPEREPGEIATQTVRRWSKRKQVTPKRMTPTSIQSQYKKNRRKAFEKIMNKSQVECNIDPDKLESHFRSSAAKTSLDKTELDELYRNVIKKKTIGDDFCDPFTAEEILEALAKTKDTAPGIDGVRYSELLWFDPSGQRLAQIYNECLHHQRIPAQWKEAETILIYKGGDKNDPGNWRPISLMPTIYKLYSSLWNRRIQRVPGIISKCQKGFQEREGCSENISILRTAIDAARGTKGQLSAVWLDLRNAFGSVPHELIRQSLDAFGFPEPLLNIVADIYNGSSIRVKCGDVYTNPIPILSGVKQGDPISPTLFNICLELVIRRSLSRHNGHKLLGSRIKILAFADDLAILADNRSDLQKELTKLEDDCSKVNLVFKPSKCASLTLMYGRPTKDTLRLQGEDLRVLGSADAYKYLGIMTGADNRTSIEDLLVSATAQLEAVTQSDLAPWQKLDAIKSFVLPRLTYTASNSTPKLCQLSVFSTKVMAAAKQCHSIPIRGGPNDYVQMSIKDGGLGLLCPKLSALVNFFASTMKKLWSKEKFTRSLHWDYLTRIVKLQIKGHPQTSDIVNYLNSDKTLTDHTMGFTVFSRIRECIRAFAFHSNSPLHSFKFGAREGRLVIKIKATANSEEVTLDEAMLPKLQKTIKRLMQIAIHQSFIETKKTKSRVSAVVAQHPASNRLVRDGGLASFSAHKFVHRARLDALVCNASSRGNDDSRCRRCGGPHETIPHILNHCRYTLGREITDRHNRVLFKLADAIKCGKKKDWKLTIDESHGSDMQRPDIVLISPDKKKAVIADVTIPFENGCQAMEDAAERKIAKYSPLVDYYAALGTKAKVKPFVIGSLGTWWPDNCETLSSLGIHSEMRRMLTPRLLAMVLEDSKNIYWYHIYGSLYQRPNPPEIWSNYYRKFPVPLSDKKGGEELGNTTSTPPTTKINTRPNPTV